MGDFLEVLVRQAADVAPLDLVSHVGCKIVMPDLNGIVQCSYCCSMIVKPLNLDPSTKLYKITKVFNFSLASACADFVWSSTRQPLLKNLEKLFCCRRSTGMGDFLEVLVRQAADVAPLDLVSHVGCKIVMPDLNGIVQCSYCCSMIVKPLNLDPSTKLYKITKVFNFSLASACADFVWSSTRQPLLKNLEKLFCCRRRLVKNCEDCFHTTYEALGCVVNLQTQFDMESGDTCGSVIGRNKKVDKTRRSWTAREEDVLIAALKDVVTKGWKSENGFRSGYLTLLESAMHVSLPRTDLRGNPHINSKVHVWKKTYGGLSFRSMRHKQWRHYPDWCDIFGNDRATGKHSQTFENALKDVLKLDDDVPDEIQFGDACAFNTFHGDEDSISETHATSSKPNVETTSKKRKRKPVNEVDEAIVAAINNLADITKATMNDLVKQLAVPDNLSNTQDVVLDALREMNELSDEEQVIAAQLLFNNHNNLALFKRLNDKGKLTLVKRLLRGD
ncbi:hypothetical protein F511_22399 [Dorcoceras hygrometricum]|uniref:Myb/SANT-like domain-containing protein n=1 Tax=Dorcoceras hygrometricum TaxID=472368 RepID=A0A2Z7BBQ3_9LAMI|nr:hypothetical protein F511_22399 [Dorcoceras hygrometricum]